MRAVPIKMYVLLIWPRGAGKVQHTCLNLPLIACHLHSKGRAGPRACAAGMVSKVSDAAIVLCLLNKSRTLLTWDNYYKRGIDNARCDEL